MDTDLSIARSVVPRPIVEVAADLGISPEDVVPYGRYKAKISASGSGGSRGRLVLVSGLTPTRAGEGKTTVSIGLAMGLARLGLKAAAALREPSLGPVMGLKGGATGGGHAQVIPMEDINLHFTGDLHAVTAANNLLAALVDNHLHFGNVQQLEARTVSWRRVLDVNDRALRQVVSGLGGPTMGIPRETGFDITAASEVMAILCLAKDLRELRARLADVLVGTRRGSGTGVTAGDLEASGAMAVLLRDAMWPNLVQTLEGTPVFVHGGPFANIAHGCSSVSATRTALSHADWVVTEAGFGFDLGAEKFLHIKCRSADLAPHVVVIVATIRALKVHGGVVRDRLSESDPDAVRRGLVNLEHHLRTAEAFGLRPVVALNRFVGDTDVEIGVVEDFSTARDTAFAVCSAWADGGVGAEALARRVVEVGEGAGSGFEPMYGLEQPFEEKLDILCRRVYGADGFVSTELADRDLRRIHRLGFGGLPICVAKTPFSLSDDPRRIGRPEGFRITVREIRIAAGAGFLIPIAGDVSRMPGLPRRPAATGMGLDDEGRVRGLT